MPPVLIDLIIVGLILGMTYALLSEGLWGSALMFFNVLFAGIIAFNFYEPLAELLAANVSFISGFADTLCLMALFIVALVMLRLTTESIAPSMVRFPSPVYNIGRFFFGLAGASVTMAILLVAFETAPVHKKVFTVVDYETKPPFKHGPRPRVARVLPVHDGPDLRRLRHRQARPVPRVRHREGLRPPRPSGSSNHQDARPYGDRQRPGKDAAPERRRRRGGAAGGAGMPAGRAPAGGRRAGWPGGRRRRRP